MKIVAQILALVSVLLLAGCSEVVPPAHRGKVLSGSGYSEQTYSSGRLWPVAPWNTVVFLDMSTNTISVPYEVFMADKLLLTGDVVIRARLRDDDQALTNKMFDDIKLDITRERTLSFNRVWAVYADSVVKNEIRNVFSKTTWDEISSNYDKFGAAIAESVRDRLKNTPIEVGVVNLGSIAPPAAIAKKYEETERRIMDLAKEEADHAVAAKKKANELDLAVADGKIAKEKATNTALSNQIVAESLSPELVRYRSLEVLQTVAPNANTFVVPYESLSSPAMQGSFYRKQ